MSYITHILVILLLTTFVNGSPIGCEVLHRVIYGCRDQGDATIENCLRIGMGPLDLMHQMNVDEFLERVRGSVSNQEAYDTYLGAIGACARGGMAETSVPEFQSSLECQFNFARVMAKAIGCLD